MTSLAVVLVNIVFNVIASLVEMYDAAFAIEMQNLFAHGVADAHEYSLTKWLNSPWYWKLIEHMLAPFRCLL